MDFMIDDYGELCIEVNNENKNSLLEAKNDELRKQIAVCRIMSVTHDWFYDNVGSDLEQIIGEALNEHTMNLGKELIIDSLTKNNFLTIEEIIVENVVIDFESIGYNVYIKQIQRKDIYTVIKVSLDLIKGITIKVVGDINVNIK